jgi:hypothetical protein
VEDIIVEAGDYNNEGETRLVTFKRTIARKTTTSSPAASPAAATPAVTTPRPKNVQLPKLAFAKFNGDILKWQTFFDSFPSSCTQ